VTPPASPLQSARVVAPIRGLVVLLGCFMMLQPLSTDLYLVSMPGLTQRFDATPATVQLTLSVFALGFGAMQLLAGPLSDRFGRRRVVLAGIALYVIASLACAAAPTIELLIAARFVQALGCCSVVVAARAIIRDVYGPVDGARALARALTVLAFGPIMGPILGSMLEVRFGHQATFLALAAFAGLLLVAAAARLPETNRHRNPTAMHPGRLVANYALVLRSREFNAFALLGIATYGGLFAFIAGSSFVLIRVLGVPTAWFGVLYAAIIVGYLAGTLACPKLLARGGLRMAVTTGTALAAIGGTAMLALALADIRHPAAVALPQFVYMASHGINFPCAMAGTVSPFPRHAGAAAGMFGFLAMVVAALISVAIGAAPDGTVVPMAGAIAGASVISTLAVAFLIRPLLASHPQ